ncbi:hypothetical protein GWK08_13285 [Leptobacterium flavescens]|uniref:FAD:protein FMN transferase n=1 Tax=Leptobacterium flavescens TaxID=472055 RepID=A0A6P0UM51_9FLAO|nr:FAD:protein FMN transferase [Leptobacterium flavescens]NER14421.1 hypothetical protein [Leptobacterium flavescens]
MTLVKTMDQLHHFEHQAMATQFSIQLIHEDKEYAQSVAQSCFMRIDELELKLSRFIPDSDISRINKMQDGTELLLDYETYDCLKKSIEVMQLTNGIFDIGMAKLTDVFRGFKKGILNMAEYKNAIKEVFEEKQQGSIYLDPDEKKIYCIKEGIKIDLGGIGKGYALDQIALILNEHRIDSYALNAGESTVLVKNHPDRKPFWEYGIASMKSEKELKLKDTAVSASGFYWNDRHIFNPRTGNNDQTPEFERVWLSCDEAAYSDAYSTAFFLMNEAEIREVIKSTDTINWGAYSKDGEIHFISDNAHTLEI